MDLAAGIRGKRVFVTGASSGLGAHFARVLAGCGAAVAIGARRRERLDDLARELDAAGAETTVAVELVVADGGASLDTAPEAFDRVVATNLRGVWLMSVAAAERWRQAKRGGAIVNIASILGFRVSGGPAAYATSTAPSCSSVPTPRAG